MKDALVKLLRVKTLVTLFSTLVFCYLSIIGKISGEQFLMIFTTIIAFYFGTQTEKRESNDSSK